MPVTILDMENINRIIGPKLMVPSGHKWDLLMRLSKNTGVSPGMGLHGEPSVRTYRSFSAYIGITVLFLDTGYYYKRLVCFPIGTEGAKSNFSLLRLGVHLLGGCLRACHRQGIQCCLVWGSDNSRLGYKAVSHCQVWAWASCWVKGMLKAPGLCPRQPPLPYNRHLYLQARQLAPGAHLCSEWVFESILSGGTKGLASVSSGTEKEHTV